MIRTATLVASRARRLGLALALSVPLLSGVAMAAPASAAVSPNCAQASASLQRYDVRFYSIGSARCNTYTKLRVITKRSGLVIDDYTQPGYQQPWSYGSVGAHLFIPQHAAGYQAVVIAYLWTSSGWQQDSYWTTGAPVALS